MTAVKKMLRTSQFALLVLLVALWFIFGLINPNITSLANFYSLTRASVIPAVFALSLMLIMVQGGIDMSFTTIGAFSSYVIIFIFTKLGYTAVPLWLAFAGSIAIAVALQLCNWVLIDKVNLQPFITTLGMQSLLKGFLLAFISTAYIYTLPTKIRDFGVLYLDKATSADGIESILHISVPMVLAMYAVVYVILQHTNFGRQAYAIGGDVDAARRAGINVSRVRLILFIMAGVICGIGGLMHDAIARASMPNPTDIVGKELNSIAAVVLGCGASKQARGYVTGTLLGVMLLQFVTTNLIMLGISSFWQQAVSGVIILVGLVIQMSKRGTNKKDGGV